MAGIAGALTVKLARVRDMYTRATRWEAVVRDDRPDLQRLQAEQAAEFDVALAEHDAQLRKQIAEQIRRNCTLDWEVMKAGGDPVVYAVADWVENPPEWVALPDLAASPAAPKALGDWDRVLNRPATIYTPPEDRVVRPTAHEKRSHDA